VTEIVQDAPAASEMPQLLDSVKGVSAWIYAIGIGMVALLVNWTDCGGLLPRTGVLGNCSPDGDRTSNPERGTPLPVRKIVRGKTGGLELIVRVALRGPVVGGVNVTPIVQVPAAGSVPPEQSSALTAKSAAFAPAKLAVPIVTIVPPTLLIVRLRGALVTVTA
jgi:hypothetical protein